MTDGTEDLNNSGIPLTHLEYIDEETLWVMAKRYYPDDVFLTTMAVKAALSKLYNLSVPKLEMPVIGSFVINNSDKQVYRVNNITEYYNTGRYNYELTRVNDDEMCEMTDDNILIEIPPYIFEIGIDNDLIDSLLNKSEVANKIKLINSKIVVYLGNLYVGDEEFAHELLNGISI